MLIHPSNPTPSPFPFTTRTQKNRNFIEFDFDVNLWLAANECASACVCVLCVFCRWLDSTSSHSPPLPSAPPAHSTAS